MPPALTIRHGLPLSAADTLSSLADLLPAPAAATALLDLWEQHIAQLPRPLPHATVRLDIAILALVGRLPGRPSAAERWGWTERATRTALDSWARQA